MQGPRVLYSFINNFCKTNFQPHGIDTIQLTNIPIDTFPGGDMNNSWGKRSILEIFSRSWPPMVHSFKKRNIGKGTCMMLLEVASFWHFVIMANFCGISFFCGISLRDTVRWFLASVCARFLFWAGRNCGVTRPLRGRQNWVNIWQHLLDHYIWYSSNGLQ